MTEAPVPILLHIGYHKTGTSWLQQRVFNDPGYGFTTPWTSMQIANHLILPHELEFSVDAARASLAAGIDLPEGLVPVLTWERLSGSPHAGGFDSALIARRLSAVFPGGRVLIVVREQRSAILALYQQYVRDGGIATLEGYLRPRNPAEIPQFRFEHLEYDRLVAYYHSLFGAESVLTLAYERLRSDPTDFLRRIREFVGLGSTGCCGVPNEVVNASFKAGTIALKRWANQWFVRNSLSPGARYYVKDHERRFAIIDHYVPSSWSRRLQDRWAARIDELVGDRYEASNARLAELTGEPLGKFGYALSRPPAVTSP
ncbi:MAG: sulfotransferase [Acidimicrobiales bacterium]|nr:sulfotransferase [Acidimicrobiales bacterium]